MCLAKCRTDHHFIISKLNIKIQQKQRPQGTEAHKQFNISQLKTPDVKQSFLDTLHEKLQSLSSEHQDVEINCATIRDVVHETALNILGL